MSMHGIELFKDNSESIGMYIHPAQDAEAIIINCPGYRGDIDGYNNKYVVMADDMVRRDIGAVIRMPNITRPESRYVGALLDDMRAVIEYAIGSARLIAGRYNPNIYLMGSSMGGCAAAAVAAEYRKVTKVLLIAPAGPLHDSFREFTGDVRIVIGKDDEVVRPQTGQMYYDLAEHARSRELVMLPNCDHQFRGKINGQILSKAPWWAFAGDTTFPSPEGGLVLYD